VNVTVRDLGLVADLATVDALVAGPFHNATFRWTQATNTFSELSDPDDLFVLNTTVSVRVNVNATTDRICFFFGIESGDGSYDVTVTSTDDGSLMDVDLYVAEFTFSFWNDAGDLINDAFELFGILGYMTTITAYINGLTGYFTESLDGVIALVAQEFRIVTLTFDSFIYWFTETLGAFLDLVQFVRDIMDGVGAYATALGSLWDWIGWNTWSPAVPGLLVVWWLISIGNRADTNPRGEIGVFLDDVQMVLNITSYFLGIFSFVANTIIDRVYGLIQALV
jgi:hypothetical protein